MFAIEVKEKNPNISEVKAQIQFGIDVMIELLPNPKICFGLFLWFVQELFPDSIIVLY